MKNTFKELLAATLVALFILTGIVTTTSASTGSTGSSIKGNSVEIQSMPTSIYISKYTKTWSKSYVIPPSKYYHTYYSNGVRYEGSLTRVSYADAVEGWLASYSGYVYQR